MQSRNPLYFGFVYNEYSDQRGGFIHLRERAAYADRVAYKIPRADGLRFGRVFMQDTLDVRCVRLCACVGSFFSSNCCALIHTHTHTHTRTHAHTPWCWLHR